MVKQNIETITKGHTYIQWVTALLANCITLAFGYESGWISPMAKYLQSDQSPTGALSDSELAWVASSLSLTAALGVPIYAYISDVYGSKLGVILLTVPQAISWLIRIVCPTTTALVIARAITGFAAGGVFNVIPMYVKEISQDNIRGSLLTLLVLMQNVGTLCIFVIGANLDYYIVMYIALALSVILGLLMIKAPPSPLFLVKQGKIEEATKIIALLRGLDKDDKIVQQEVEYMKNEEARFQALPDISIKAIVKEPSSRRGLIIILFIMTFHGTNGAFLLVTFASAILESTGVDFDISPELQSLSLPTVMIAASLLLAIIVEKCARKFLLTGAFFLSFLSMATLGAATLVKQMGGTVPSWLPVSCMIVAVAMYAGGVSPLPYIVMTELFSYQIRAKVMGGVVTYAWFTSFVTIAVFTPISIHFGEYTAFFMHGAINISGAVFVFTFLPETKGKNDEEIRQILSSNDKCNRQDST